MEFYSYLWLRKDDSPYYVGKGSGRRAFKKQGHSVNPPKDLTKIVIFPQDTEADAFESEMALIWLFGRKDLGTGCLRNLTAGGEGGSNPSIEVRQKQAENGRIQGHRAGTIYGRKNVENGHLAAISILGGQAAVKSGQLAGICAAGGRKRAMFTNHARWHVKRNKIVPTCRLCVPPSE